MTIPTWAVRGAKVVCIHELDDNIGFPVPHRIPMLGEILTISRVVDPKPGDIGYDGVCLTFDEIPEEQTSHGYTAKCSYALNCFQPLVTLRQDIRMFKSMLRDMPQETRLDRLMELLNE